MGVRGPSVSEREAGAATGKAEVDSSTPRRDSIALLRKSKLVSSTQLDLSHGSLDKGEGYEASSCMYNKHDSINALQRRSLVSRRLSDVEDTDDPKGIYAKRPSVQRLKQAGLVAQSSWHEAKPAHPLPTCAAIAEDGPGELLRVHETHLVQPEEITNATAEESPSEWPSAAGCQAQRISEQEVAGAVLGQVPDADDSRGSGAGSQAVAARRQSLIQGSEVCCWSFSFAVGCLSRFLESARGWRKLYSQ